MALQAQTVRGFAVGRARERGAGVEVSAQGRELRLALHPG